MRKFNFPELLGVSVLQKTSLCVKQSSQEFYWKGYGLKLQVPAQSLPNHIDSCTITITASLSGQYQFPADYELVSPVFWLKCEPSLTFNRPLNLEIQHCALLENSSRLSMVRAVCTQKDLPYLFKVIPSGTFTNHSTYGVIALDRFSGMGVAQEGSKEKRYLSNVFYMGPPNRREIHFTVTSHLDAHITVSYLYCTVRISSEGTGPLKCLTPPLPK